MDCAAPRHTHTQVRPLRDSFLNHAKNATQGAARLLNPPKPEQEQTEETETTRDNGFSLFPLFAPVQWIIINVLLSASVSPAWRPHLRFSVGRPPITGPGSYQEPGSDLAAQIVFA